MASKVQGIQHLISYYVYLGVYYIYFGQNIQNI